MTSTIGGFSSVGFMPALESTVDMYDLRMSDGVRPLYEKVKTFIREEVTPMSEEFFRLGEDRADRWSYAPGQLARNRWSSPRCLRSGSHRASAVPTARHNADW